MRGGADAELELLGGRGEASGLVGLKPSWPVRTTVKPQPGPGWRPSWPRCRTARPGGGSRPAAPGRRSSRPAATGWRRPSPGPWPWPRRPRPRWVVGDRPGGASASPRPSPWWPASCCGRGWAFAASAWPARGCWLPHLRHAPWWSWPGRPRPPRPAGPSARGSGPAPGPPCWACCGAGRLAGRGAALVPAGRRAALGRRRRDRDGRQPGRCDLVDPGPPGPVGAAHRRDRRGRRERLGGPPGAHPVPG